MLNLELENCKDMSISLFINFCLQRQMLIAWMISVDALSPSQTIFR